jgi:putative mRNA 3-end processing factor
MNSLFFLEEYGFLPFRRKSKRSVKPHLTLRFNSSVVTDFHIDSYRGYSADNYLYFNLITHAHSDHYGQSNMNNPFSVSSEETANILSVLGGRKFPGITFKIGEKIKLGDFFVRTYSTQHIFGSTAFLIKADSRILITGDVKDFSSLPKCDVLITEATYGSPDYIFEEEIDKLISYASNSVFGVYPVGKAQRTAKILSENGYSVSGSERIVKLCKVFGIEVTEEGEVHLVPPRDLYYCRGKRYVLTAQNFYRFPRIVISDHLDFRGLLEMIDHCSPEHVIFYHGKPSKELIEVVGEDVSDVSVLSDLDIIREFD